MVQEGGARCTGGAPVLEDRARLASLAATKGKDGGEEAGPAWSGGRCECCGISCKAQR